MNPYREYVAGYARLFREGKELPLGGFLSDAAPEKKGGGRKALIFSPHPDDECLVGGLALRLMRESGARVVNVAVTHGSDTGRRRARLEELGRACDYIGYDLALTGENGLENIHLRNREESPGDWISSVETLVEILSVHRPDVIFFPHDTDQNRTHIGTHYLVVDALERLDRGLSFYTVETEFWSPMASPNLMVELDETAVAELLAALSFHAGEVRRNPYHLRMPAWLMDNVRRGAELVGGQGAEAPDFEFAALYRLRRWELGRFRSIFERGRFLSKKERAGVLFSALGDS